MDRLGEGPTLLLALFVDVQSLVALGSTSKYMSFVINDQTLWRKTCEKSYPTRWLRMKRCFGANLALVGMPTDLRRELAAEIALDFEQLECWTAMVRTQAAKDNPLALLSTSTLRHPASWTIRGAGGPGRAKPTALDLHRHRVVAREARERAAQSAHAGLLLPPGGHEPLHAPQYVPRTRLAELGDTAGWDLHGRWHAVAAAADARGGGAAAGPPPPPPYLPGQRNLRFERRDELTGQRRGERRGERRDDRRDALLRAAAAGAGGWADRMDRVEPLTGGGAGRRDRTPGWAGRRSRAAAAGGAVLPPPAGLGKDGSSAAPAHSAARPAARAKGRAALSAAVAEVAEALPSGAPRFHPSGHPVFDFSALPFPAPPRPSRAGQAGAAGATAAVGAAAGADGAALPDAVSGQGRDRDSDEDADAEILASIAAAVEASRGRSLQRTFAHSASRGGSDDEDDSVPRRFANVRDSLSSGGSDGEGAAYFRHGGRSESPGRGRLGHRRFSSSSRSLAGACTFHLPRHQAFWGHPDTGGGSGNLWNELYRGVAAHEGASGGYGLEREDRLAWDHGDSDEDLALHLAILASHGQYPGPSDTPESIPPVPSAAASHYTLPGLLSTGSSARLGGGSAGAAPAAGAAAAPLPPERAQADGAAVLDMPPAGGATSNPLLSGRGRDDDGEGSGSTSGGEGDLGLGQRGNGPLYREGDLGLGQRGNGPLYRLSASTTSLSPRIGAASPSTTRGRNSMLADADAVAVVVQQEDGGDTVALEVGEASASGGGKAGATATATAGPTAVATVAGAAAVPATSSSFPSPSTATAAATCQADVFAWTALSARRAAVGPFKRWLMLMERSCAYNRNIIEHAEERKEVVAGRLRREDRWYFWHWLVFVLAWDIGLPTNLIAFAVLLAQRLEAQDSRDNGSSTAIVQPWFVIFVPVILQAVLFAASALASVRVIYDIKRDQWAWSWAVATHPPPRPALSVGGRAEAHRRVEEVAWDCQPDLRCGLDLANGTRWLKGLLFGWLSFLALSLSIPAALESRQAAQQDGSAAGTGAAAATPALWGLALIPLWLALTACSCTMAWRSCSIFLPIRACRRRKGVGDVPYPAQDWKTAGAVIAGVVTLIVPIAVPLACYLDGRVPGATLGQVLGLLWFIAGGCIAVPTIYCAGQSLRWCWPRFCNRVAVLLLSCCPGGQRCTVTAYNACQRARCPHNLASSMLCYLREVPGDPSGDDVMAGWVFFMFACLAAGLPLTTLAMGIAKAEGGLRVSWMGVMAPLLFFASCWLLFSIGKTGAAMDASQHTPQGWHEGRAQDFADLRALEGQVQQYRKAAGLTGAAEAAAPVRAA